MAKKLSDVLAGTNKSRTRPGSTGTRPGVDYAGKMEDERDFVAAHDVEEFDDRNGNGSDVFSATNIKHKIDNKHGHIPKPKDEKQYKMNNEESSVITSSPRPRPRPGRDLPGGGYQWPNGAVEPGPGFRPLSSDTELDDTDSEITSSPRPKARSDSMMTSSPRPKPRPNMNGANSVSESATSGIFEENEEKEMMMNQLNFIKLASDKIMAYANSTKDPEEWFQNKLSGLHANMKDLHAYVSGEKEESKQIDELSKKTLGSYAKKAKDDLGRRESEITRNLFVDTPGVKDPIKRDNSLLMKRAKRRDFINTAIDKMTKEEAEGDDRIQPKDVSAKNKGKSLKMITGDFKESRDVSRTKTGTEQARARFDKKMERKEIQKDREENDN